MSDAGEEKIFDLLKTRTNGEILVKTNESSVAKWEKMTTFSAMRSPPLVQLA